VLQVALVVPKELQFYFKNFGGTQDPLGTHPKRGQKPELPLASLLPLAFAQVPGLSPPCSHSPF